MVLLPFKDKTLPLHINLALVEEMESVGGGLYGLAEKLVVKDLPFSEAISLLHIVYAQAGASVTMEELGDYLLTHGPTPPVLLSEILVAILHPLQKMNAVKDHEGKS